MATKFMPWMGDGTVSAGDSIKSAEAWASDTTRSNGWESGDAVDSQEFNTVLRQDSLIVTALMKAFCDDSVISHLSSLNDVVTVLLAAIPKKSEVPDVTTLTSNLASLQTVVGDILNGSRTVGNSAALGGQAAANWQRKILTGTAAPSGGNNGDIYLQYE